MSKANTNQPDIEAINLTREDVAALKSRLVSSSLANSDIKILSGAIEMVVWLQQSLSNTRHLLKTLRSWFSFQSESKKKACNRTPSQIKQP